MRRVLAIVVAVAVGGCGAPPELDRSGTTVPAPSASAAPPTTSGPYPPGFTPRPVTTPSASPSPSPTATPFSEVTTAPCGTAVTAAQVIALVKRETSIEPSRAIAGPLCSGTWHYTMVEVPGGEPVQVVTRDGLKLVAAGTEVCTVDVRLQAPAGIKAEVCQ